jgi:alpha-beta hydrolase superfamily lysophospholipase
MSSSLRSAAALLAALALPAPAAAAPLPVSLRASDGLVLRASWYPAARRSGSAVLLLHEMCGNRNAWAPFLADLSAAGVDALAVDLRGFGETGGAMQWSGEVADARAWLGWLRAQAGVERVGTLGAGLGAKLALVACAAEPRCLAAAALSPYGKFTPAELDFRDRAVFLVGVRGDDVKSALAVRGIAADVQGDATIRLIAGIEPGIAAVAEAGMLGDVVAWLDHHLRAPSPAP